jgi:O-antigen biosynthesis protein WbqP
MKRSCDLILASLLFVFFLPEMLIIAVLIKLLSHGPVLYWSDRIGINNTVFRMAKFRTMKVNTPAVATHLMKDPQNYLTPLGAWLRKYSLDEIPQLINILKGDMSFVGPRPALFNQDDLIALRSDRGIHQLVPGLTGLAQINGRDNLPIPVKVNYDEYYLKHRGLLLDFTILCNTFLRVIKTEGVRH